MTGPALVCPGCGSPDVSLERLFCGTCAAVTSVPADEIAAFRPAAEEWTPEDIREFEVRWRELTEHPSPMTFLVDGWRERAELAEARLARIAAHCRERMNGPGRGGMSRAAAGIILGIAEGTYKETRDG